MDQREHCIFDAGSYPIVVCVAEEAMCTGRILSQLKIVVDVVL